MEKKIKINEIIIVEGRDDVTALKRVIDGHIISLNGFSGLNKKIIEKLVDLSKKNELILFTDPDFSGKKIRDKIQRFIPNIKHMFISREDAIKINKGKANIGVENATNDKILKALKNVVKLKDNFDNIINETFTMSDLIDNNLTVGNNSKVRREKLGDKLGIGYYNSKQLLSALNSFNISKKDFENAILEING